MALDDDIRILSRVRLFEDFTTEQLRLLAFGAEDIRLARGRVLYREGQAAESAYVVIEGTIRLFRERGGVRQDLASAGAGSMLGEIGLIAQSRRLTGAAAASDVELIRLNRTLFRRILSEYPETAAMLHARISTDLKTLLDRIQALGPKFAD